MNTTQHLLHELWMAAGGRAEIPATVRLVGRGSLPSIFAVSELATASVATAACAVAELVALRTGVLPGVEVDRRLASFWFASSLRPRGWQLPPLWDPIAGDYATSDGWIRLHTNAPRHRAAALAVLAVPAERPAVAGAVASWSAEELEQAVVERGGCAAALRSRADWEQHSQGQAVAREPLLHVAERRAGAPARWETPAARPLAGVRVLDLTRVLAGPVATRFLAGLGADVLRIDPPDWEEPGVVPEVTLGKRCARLDLRRGADRQRLSNLLRSCDVLVHGYRPDALGRLGLGPQERERLRPGLVDVYLDAYGWTGPWRDRRGFDSLVQMSTGIAAEGMRRTGRDAPVPLPVQALDHATGYLLAAAAVRGLLVRWTTGAGWQGLASLARTAEALVRAGEIDDPEPLAPETTADLSETVERTAWGPARRLRPPVTIEGVPLVWHLPARPLGSSPAVWS